LYSIKAEKLPENILVIGVYQASRLESLLYNQARLPAAQVLEAAT